MHARRATGRQWRHGSLSPLGPLATPRRGYANRGEAGLWLWVGVGSMAPPGGAFLGEVSL
jgi:hypothetical protein